MSTGVVAPIDHLCRVVDGRYEDAFVVVQAIANAWPHRARGSVRTEHFDVGVRDGRLEVTHSVSRQHIDDNLTGLIVDELFTPGWVRGPEMFERILTGIVLSMEPDPAACWELFYRQTLAGFDEVEGCAAATEATEATGATTVERYAPIYREAVRLTGPGSALEVGSCFGFLSLLLARRGHKVTVSDIAAASVDLIAVVAPRLGVTVIPLRADAARVPLADHSIETVLAVHLLEQLDPEHGRRALAEALRCARRRVVVAVSLEPDEDESDGHIRSVDLGDLERWGEWLAEPFEVHEAHGDGWLVVDRREGTTGRRDLR